MKYDAQLEQLEARDEHLDIELLEDSILRGDELDEAACVHLEACDSCREHYEQFVAECTLFDVRRAIATEPAPFLAPEALTETRETPRPILFRLMPVVVAVAACAAVFLLNVSSVPRRTPAPDAPRAPIALSALSAKSTADDDGILLSSSTLACLDESLAVLSSSSSSGRVASACEAPAPSLFAQRTIERGSGSGNGNEHDNACAYSANIGQSSETHYACEELVTSSFATP